MMGFRKADEMDTHITFRAVRLAWVYSALFLLVWIGSDWIINSSFNWIAFILFSSQQIVYWTVQLFLKWKLGKDEK